MFDSCAAQTTLRVRPGAHFALAHKRDTVDVHCLHGQVVRSLCNRAPHLPQFSEVLSTVGAAYMSLLLRPSLVAHLELHAGLLVALVLGEWWFCNAIGVAYTL